MFKMILSAMAFMAVSAFQAQANLCAAHLTTPKIVLISGTDRPDSNTLKISKQVVEMMKSKGHDVTLVDVMDMDTTSFKGQYFKTSPEFREGFTNKIKSADAVIFVFPEYYGDIPGALKTLIDYLAPTDTFTDKPVAMITDAAGMQGGIRGADTLAGIMRHRGANVSGSAIVYIPGVGDKIVSDRIEDAGTLKRIEAAVTDISKKASEKYRMQLQINTSLEFGMALNKVLDVELSSGAYVTGHLSEVHKDARGFVTALSFSGQSGITNAGKLITYQLLARHAHGTIVPVGLVKTAKGMKALSEIGSVAKLEEAGFKMRQPVTLTYASGFEVKGLLTNAFFSPEGKLQVLTLNDAQVFQNGRELKEQATDLMDLVIGESIVNVVAKKDSATK